MTQPDVPSLPDLLQGQHILIGILNHGLKCHQSGSCFSSMKQSQSGQEAGVILELEQILLVDSPNAFITSNGHLDVLSLVFSVEIGLRTETIGLANLDDRKQLSLSPPLLQSR